jgi:hypothetical protein
MKTIVNLISFLKIQQEVRLRNAERFANCAKILQLAKNPTFFTS